MNVFQSTYDARLSEWYQLRQTLKNQSVETICVEVDKWWQQAPLVNHYLHPDLVNEWPNPWELLLDNTYCIYARGLGMIYTLSLLGLTDIAFVDALDYNKESAPVVLVNQAKYILNYWPGMVLNTKLQEFQVIKHIDAIALIK